MVYESPAVLIVGTASELIQNSAFSGLDGGPTGHNHLPVLPNLEDV